MFHQTIRSDLSNIADWAHQWKMRFNPNVRKQAVEVIFWQQRCKPQHPAMSFNTVPVKRDREAHHSGVILDDKLNFRRHISDKIKVANKGLGLLTFLYRYATHDKLVLCIRYM